MEAYFTVSTKLQQKSMLGPISKRTLKGLLKIHTRKTVNIVIGVLRSKLEENWKWKINLDITSMVLARGLQFEREDTLKLVMFHLFDEGMLLGTNHILEWIILGWLTDISQGPFG